MAVYLLCLTADGGVPLFTRSKGNVEPLPFPVIGSLNGVHMFAGSHDVQLLSTSTCDAKVACQVFHNSITLIIVTQDDNASDAHLKRLLDYVFHAMLLVYGLDDLTNIKNIERFKREIKVCFGVIDGILDSSHTNSFSYVTGAIDIIAAPENSILQNYLDAFTEAAKSQYGCVLVLGKVAVATQKWWELMPTEVVLLSCLVRSSSACSSRDVPVFLPHSSPQVPHRLLTFHMLPGVEVCVLCGPQPTLTQLEQEVQRFWQSGYDTLKALLRLHPRSLPYTVPLDINILGLMLINIETYRCVSTVQPIDEDSRKLGKTLSTSERYKILRSFYKLCAGGVYPVLPNPTNNEEPPEIPDQLALPHTALDTYIICDTHKCYAYRLNQYQLFLLFTTSVPTYAMRSIASTTLNIILRDKSGQV